MPTQIMTSTVTRNTRNSRNSGSIPGIAFGAHIPARATPKRNSNRTTDDDPWGSINGAPGDDSLITMTEQEMEIQMMNQTMMVLTTPRMILTIPNMEWKIIWQTPSPH
jgi:hypothetical protein